MIQTTFLIRYNRIIGVGNRRWKTCKWCGHTFMPHHNKQAYCDNTCRDISREKYKADWMYHRRVLEREGVIVNDHNILNVGTGGLGEHRCNGGDSVEHEKIMQELVELGLRRR